MYGTTYQGGEYNAGVLFKLTLDQTWTENLLYTLERQITMPSTPRQAP